MKYQDRRDLIQRTQSLMRWMRWDRDGDDIRNVARAVVALDIEACLGHGYRERRPSALPEAPMSEALKWLVLAKELGLIEVSSIGLRLGDTTGDSDATLDRIEAAQRATNLRPAKTIEPTEGASE